jgi:hypothetical protein
MARPITWQNVQGPDSSSGFRAIEAAGRSINAAFDQFGGLIKDAQAVDTANWEQVKKNNTQEFLNKLYSVQGPERFQAMQESGELQAMIAKNGAQIDQAAARSALDGRLANLQQRATQGIAYKNTLADQANIELDRAEAPKRDEIASLMAKGDKASIALAKQISSTLTPRGRAIVDGKISARDRELVVQGQEDTVFLRNGEMHDATLTNMEHQQKIARGQLAVSQGQLGVAQAGERRANLTQVTNLQTQLNEALAKTGGNNPRTAQGSKALFDGLAQVITDKDEFDVIRSLVGSALQDPKYAGLSSGDLLTAATSLRGVSNWFTGDSKGQFRKNLDALIANGVAGSNEASTQAARAALSLQSADMQVAGDAALRAFLQGIGGGPGGARPAPQPANPVDVSIPAPVPQPAPAPGAAKPDRFAAAMRDLAKLEQQEIQAGVRNDFSPEVKAFFEGEKKSSTKADRAAIKNVVRQLGVGTANMANAAADLFTMPVRGVVAGVNQIPRLARASGLDVPDIPFFGTDSLTPYSDLKERQRAGQWTPAELAQKRKLLEEELKKAR